MLDPIEKLFAFPIVMVDGAKEDEKEQRRRDLSIDMDDVEMIIGEAECPYYDFVSVTDRWLPTEESYAHAQDNAFDACSVYFAQSGTFVVPWNKERFKRELKKFIQSLPKEAEDIRLLALTKDGIREILPEDDKG